MIKDYKKLGVQEIATHSFSGCGNAPATAATQYVPEPIALYEQLEHTTIKSMLDYLNEVSQWEGYVSWAHCCKSYTDNKTLKDRNMIPQTAAKKYAERYASLRVAQEKAELIEKIEKELRESRQQLIDRNWIEQSKGVHKAINIIQNI